MGAPATAVNNLPRPLTRFVGREAELAEAAALLAEARLLTLTGPGGGGKTRLALQLATTVSEDFPDGVWFVDLSSLSDGEFVLDQVAITMKVDHPGRGGTLAEAVAHRLAQRRALVVLDNCEHVVDKAAEITAGLLTAAPALKVVATSREPLDVGGEVTWNVPPLCEEDALELFVDRARLARPRFELREEDDDAARYICRRLDGVPLAIELAAARARALAPARIAADIRGHFRLPSGPRTAPSRQATLLASFEWSYELLSEAERALLRQLSVFAGGFDVEAVLTVCPAATLDLLGSLAGRSLIAVEERSGLSEPRYRMLETIREFAAARLTEAGEEEMVHERHRDYYTELAEIAEPGLTSPDDARWQALLATEQENLRSAMAWSRDRGDSEALARLIAPLGMLWTLTNRMVELTRWLDAATAGAGEVSPQLRARLLYYECMMALFTGRRWGEVPALANEGLALARAAGSKRDEAFALVVLGMVAGLIGGAQAMRPYVEEAVPVARSAGFAYGVVMALEFFVVLRLFQSQPEENSRLIEEAIAVAKSGVQRHTQLTVRSFSGVIALTQGRLADAHQIFAAVVADGREMTDFNYLHSLIHVGLVEMFRGDLATARSLIAESLAAAERSEAEGRSAAGVAPHARLVLGWVNLAGGDVLQARDSLAEVVEAIRSSIVGPIVPLPLVLLAEALLALGALEEADAAVEEAISVADSREQIWLVARAKLVKAKLHARQGDMQEAESLVQEALNLGREAGDQMGLVDGLEQLAKLAAEQDSYTEATRLSAAAESLRSDLGYRFAVDRPGLESALAQARQTLGPEGFAAAWAEGARLSPEEAIAYAARGRGERKRPARGWASLTPSEREVVRLVGHHLSNPEIAARLFVSRATVKTHLVHIFAKLGINSRSELAAEAVKRGTQAQPSGRG
ncbi:MAG TPA: LuxR C-terminal-related transcriptional regulator [Candidatus Dormibacteraeota bacterium]|nr:LuxR C-terminal-related transcriptional regulator [Candidatus Dormibacteraeota bacterium]